MDYATYCGFLILCKSNVRICMVTLMQNSEDYVWLNTFLKKIVNPSSVLIDIVANSFSFNITSNIPKL